MDNITKQDRITLKTLKVADFASEETMCFSATVVFDGTPIAEARNDGHGGSTFLRALSGKAALLAPAEDFATGLPPAPLNLEIGSATCRGRVCQYVEVLVVRGS